MNVVIGFTRLGRFLTKVLFWGQTRALSELFWGAETLTHSFILPPSNANEHLFAS